jgi:hypothetical protein
MGNALQMWRLVSSLSLLYKKPSPSVLISDIQGALIVGVITDFFLLWDLLSDFKLQPKIEDRHVWRLASNGQYSAKLAYEDLFLGSTLFRAMGKDLAPPKCRFFLWLIAHNRYWTADRLFHRVSLTLSTVLCVTKQQKPFIISLFFVSSQENSSSVSCHKLACNLSPLSPLISHFFIGGIE